MLKKLIAAGLMAVLTVLTGMGTAVFAADPSEGQMRVTMGQKKVANQNIQQAKQTAISDALDVALQNAFSQLVSGPVLAANLDFFYDRILPRTNDYIVTYRVLGEIENNGYYRVGVESRVDMALLEKNMIAARILSKERNRPSIVLLIAEKTPSDLLPRYWWGQNPIPYESVAEKTIVENLRQAQFVFAGRKGGQRPVPESYNITFDTIYDDAAAIKLGRELKADILVFGKAESVEAINRMGEEKTFHAGINLDGYHLESGEKVFVSHMQAVVKHQDSLQGNQQALVKAAALSAQDLMAKIDGFWQANLRKEHSFDFRLEGDDFLSRFIAVKKQLRQMPGIENMQPKEVGTNSAVMELFYKGPPSQFVDDIMLKTFDSFGLEILEVTADQVSVRFIGKGEPSRIDGSAADSAGMD